MIAVIAKPAPRRRTERTVAAGTRVYAEVAGPPDGPDLVCVHGLGASHRYFRPFMTRMASDYRVSAPDLPGFGHTPGPRQAVDVRGLSLALADWLRATGRDGAVLVANSAGCQVVVDMCVHSPELAGPIVLNGPTIDWYARSGRSQLARFVSDAPFEHPGLLFTVAGDYADAGVRRIVQTLRYLLNDPIECKLRHVGVPAVVARGSRDPLVTRAWAEDVVARLPDGYLVEVPGAGHTLNYSAPDELATITRALVAAAQSPSHDGWCSPRCRSRHRGRRSRGG